MDDLGFGSLARFAKRDPLNLDAARARRAAKRAHWLARIRDAKTDAVRAALYWNGLARCAMV
jgi:hypothetical protein